MMCSLLLSREMLHGRFVHLIDRVFSGLAEWYGRKLERSLDYRPVTALFAAAVFASLVFMYMNTKAELAPEEDQGVLFALTKAPQYSNLNYQEAYTDKLDHAFGSFPETDLRFIVNGRFGPSQGIAGAILKPWGERSRSSQQLKPLMQQKASAVEGMNAFVFSLPPLPGSIGGLPVQMVIYSTGVYKDIYLAMEKIKAAARKSGLFMVIDSDLDFNQPTIQVKVDRSKVNELGLTMQSIGDTLALLVGENYINRFPLDGRAYQVIPQMAGEKSRELPRYRASSGAAVQSRDAQMEHPTNSLATTAAGSPAFRRPPQVTADQTTPAASATTAATKACADHSDHGMPMSLFFGLATTNLHPGMAHSQWSKIRRHAAGARNLATATHRVSRIRRRPRQCRQARHPRVRPLIGVVVVAGVSIRTLFALLPAVPPR
jgi:multidrug efflux pump subunit AcrB